MLTIREYVDADKGAIISLWQETGLSRKWNDPGKDIDFCTNGKASNLFVGVLDNAIIATIMTGHDGHRGVIYYLGVLPAHQGQGYGVKMVHYAEDWLRQHGVWKLNLMIREDNADVQNFYQSMGYEEEPRVVMSKRLETRT